MIPLRDNVPSRTTPVVNYAMSVICGLVYLVQAQEPEQRPALVERFGLIPACNSPPGRIIEVPDVINVQTPFGVQREKVLRPAAESAVPPMLTLVTCIFLHGGLMHFLGNMWFLFIFGDNVEDRFGHITYLMFYLASGMAASLAHYIADPTSPIPTIGASGAIAGVMGAYFVFYPKARVLS